MPHAETIVEKLLKQNQWLDTEIHRLRLALSILKASNLNGTGPYDARLIIDSALNGHPIPPMPEKGEVK